MQEKLPKFDAPPLIETVLSAQFARLPNFNSTYCGWFWKNYLDEYWSQIRHDLRIEDQFERFGKDLKWSPVHRPNIQLARAGESTDRVQIVGSDEERMIQIQDSRFIYNWRKQEKGYPSFEEILGEFNRYFSSFNEFTHDASLGGLDLNQWEVTYVNHLPQGELWQSVTDWVSIIPGFNFPASGIGGLAPSNFRGEWQLDIKNNLGRLHISFSRVKKLENDREVFTLQLTARGPISTEAGISLEEGFKIGHECIVRAFTEMTSPELHKLWKRTQ